MKDRLRILSFKIPILTTIDIAYDSIETFKKLGHLVTVIELPNSGRPKEDVLQKEIAKFSPDLVFTVDHIGIVPQVLTGMKIPHVSWFVDNPFLWWRTPEIAADFVSPYCCIFTWDRVYIEALKDLGFKHVFYLPIATNPEIFKPIDLTAEEIEKFACNLSFAGDSMYYCHQKLYRDCENPRVRSVVDEVVKMQSENPLFDVGDILERVQKAHHLRLIFNNPDEEEAFNARLEFAAMARYRRDTLREIADLGLSLAGDENWKDFLEREVDISMVKFFPGKGFDYKTELPKLYNVSKININITKAQSKTSLPMRIFDISACGAFMLTDYRRDLEELFDLGNEVVFYRNKEDLRKKAIYYLDHSEERQKIAQRAQIRVFSQHTYRHRIEEILNKTREIFDF